MIMQSDVNHIPALLAPYVGVCGRYPFRIGTTSFIVPADILPNVQILAGLVDDVELLVFESDVISPLPAAAVVQELHDLRQNHDLTYTVHMPIDVDLLHADAALRRAETQKWLRAAERLAWVESGRLVVHLPDDPGNKASREAVMQEVAFLCSSGIAPHCICVENIGDDLAGWEPWIREMGLSVCIDIGHLLLHGYDPLVVLERIGDKVRILHVHGVADGKDHRDLGALDEGLLRNLLGFAQKSGPDFVFTMEVFGAKPLARSLAVLERMAACM